MSDPSTSGQVPAKRGGPFVKGVSGNPAGRPKGTRNQITLDKMALEGELRRQLKNQIGDVLKKAIELALEGDTSMIKLLIDKVLPTTRSVEDDAPIKERIQIVINKLPDAQPMKVVSNVIEG